MARGDTEKAIDGAIKIMQARIHAPGKKSPLGAVRARNLPGCRALLLWLSLDSLRLRDILDTMRLRQMEGACASLNQATSF